MTLKMIVCGIMVVCLSFLAVAEEPPISLDGKSFIGELKATNTWLRIGVKGSIHFEAGHFYWATEKNDDDIQTASYRLEPLGDHVIFTARVAEAENSQDFIDWQGQFDGQTVSEVKATWTRIEKDFIHDLMLPDQVIFQFKPKKDN